MADNQRQDADTVVVQRNQCSGRTMACINCNAPLGGRHDILCYEFAKTRQAGGDHAQR